MISLYNPSIIPWRLVVIFDSTKVIDSPIINFFCVNLTISTVVAFSCPAKTAIAPLDAPFILSPKIVFVFKDNPLTKTNLSNFGVAKFTDSNIPTMLNTSGVFNDISLSSILKP